MLTLNNTLFWCFTYIFLSFALCFLRYIYTRSRTVPECVSIEARDCENEIEYILRRLLKKYPYSEIDVLYEPSCDCTLEILQKMSADFPRVVICENDDFTAFSPVPFSKVPL